MGESEVAACSCRSREHGWYVALCDEICDNDDGHLVAYRSRVL